MLGDWLLQYGGILREFSLLCKEHRLGEPPTDTGDLLTLQMIFLCVKMIHNTVYKMFIVFCSVRILCILYTYGIFHTVFYFDTYGSMECM